MKTIFRTFQSIPVTMKIRSRSPKSEQLVPLSTLYICKFVQNTTKGSEDNARKKSYGTLTLTPMPTGSAQKTICHPHPSGLEDIITCKTSKCHNHRPTEGFPRRDIENTHPPDSKYTTKAKQPALSSSAG